jgi:hypothetical protein
MLKNKMRLKVCVFSVLLIFVSVTIYGAKTDQESHQLASFKPVGNLMDEQSYGDYIIRTYSGEYVTIGSDDYDGSFDILKKGVRVYGKYGTHSLEIGKDILSIGNDITGDGQPNLVIIEHSGGYHCCYLFHIFEIGHRFRYMETLTSSDGGSDGSFYNMDNDPALEFNYHDDSFAYWRTSFADSPTPLVIMKFRGKKYEIACDLMRKPALSRDKLDSLAAEIKSLKVWKTNHPPVKLWSEMLDLIYTCNTSQAWKLFDLTWPKGIKGKQAFLKSFKDQFTEPCP